jgi:hypothetical protein
MVNIHTNPETKADELTAMNTRMNVDVDSDVKLVKAADAQVRREGSSGGG